MGGNSISSTPSRRVTTPTTTPKQKKLDKVLQEMRELSPGDRRTALSSLRKSGMKDLAKALEALIPSGSHPAERRGSGGGSSPKTR